MDRKFWLDVWGEVKRAVYAFGCAMTSLLWLMVAIMVLHGYNVRMSAGLLILACVSAYLGSYWFALRHWDKQG